MNSSAPHTAQPSKIPFLLGGVSLLKSCLQEADCDGYGSRRGWVTLGLGPFPQIGFRKGGVPRARALPFARQGLLAGPLPSPLSSFFSYLLCFLAGTWNGLGVLGSILVFQRGKIVVERVWSGRPGFRSLVPGSLPSMRAHVWNRLSCQPVALRAPWVQIPLPAPAE